ncbi:MAG: sugar ABC transporter ATP-binding protein [Trueperaceae bacterium]|jgi:ribose transport system ATP-binding protein|nr:sugar ABC transporter ATP-binding protein [Truepera sp.]HRN18624.1 sugar ABC transporter ATP-binding protein [Trueperaceae bacterium]
MPDSPLLTATALSHAFGPVEVLHGVDIDFQPGEVHALVGENGAGKSTLMKCLSGYLQPTSGDIRLQGQEVRFRGSGEAEALGLVLIHQEFNLAGDLTVEENVFLGRELTRGPFLDKAAMRARTAELLTQLETTVDPRTRVDDLSVSDKQMVEIAKAVSREVRVLFMDEPTDVLTGAETEVLFGLIRRLAAEGVAVVYVSHKLDEVMAIADRVTILRDGNHIATKAIGDTSEHDMARLMVGRDLADMYPEKQVRLDAPVMLEVRDFHVPGAVTSASFDLHAGEVLAFSGLVGAGRTELFEGLLGLRPGQGSVRVRGEAVHLHNPEAAKRAGIAYLTEDRKGKGLMSDMRLRPNLTLQALERFARPFLDERAERGALEQAQREFDIRAAHLDVLAGTLSGGNQQKLVLAKIMLTQPDIVILDEPTRGIDVGTKREIYFYIAELARLGKAVVVISSEMSEVIGLAHRVVVMRSGRITGVLSETRITEEEIVQFATGLKDEGSGYGHPRHDAVA